MKNLINILVLLMLVACSSENENEQQLIKQQTIATIIAPDVGQCVCCGGYFITIDDQKLRFLPSNLPANNIDFSIENLPLQVTIDWEYTEPSDCSDLITILSIE